MNLCEDLGAYLSPHQDETKRTVLTPGLRELICTAPYMHNRMIKRLEEVVDFYDVGGGDDPHTHAILQPLGLKLSDKGIWLPSVRC